MHLIIMILVSIQFTDVNIGIYRKLYLPVNSDLSVCFIGCKTIISSESHHFLRTIIKTARTFEQREEE